jgi:tRNA-2-methylthio-N6-dimethylallyladenosine synthase
MEMPRYYIWTIGCQMNKAESERLGSYLEEMGYQATDAPGEADLILLNSCVVRQSAEDRIINKLNGLKAIKEADPSKTLAITGCLVNSEMDALKKKFPYVDYFFKPGDYPPWLAQPAPAQVIPSSPSPSVFVPIIQGCNNFCAYCIVPYRRGRERSRPLTEIVCEVSALAQHGAREVILLGQNVDSYGHDLPDRPDLADLLTELNGVEGLARIRFLTNHPKDMSRKLIEAIASLDKVCEQISLPVQSGSDDILKAMRRGYTAAQYRRLIAQIREEIPGIALSTDVVVGFPTESENQFQETVDLLSEAKFAKVHIAAYSPRPGTIAAREFEDNVPTEEKRRRLSIIEQLEEKIAAEINAGTLGENVEILVEGKNKDKWWGRTRTDKLVFFSDSADYTGRLVNVRITKTSPWSLQGNLIQEQGGKE